MSNQIFSNPREDRLKNEWSELQELNDKSETVQVVPINRLPGSEPDEFRITLRCKGILRLDRTQEPVFGNIHTVLMKCDDDFPNQPPALYWETDIWHPNIDHERKSVCINASEWVGSQSLVDVCRKVFEMAQYKSYHALNEPPYPLDHTVADWVRQQAEPRGLVDKQKNIAIDNRPLYRPTAPISVSVKPRAISTAPRTPQIRFSEPHAQPAPAPARSRSTRIRMVG